MPTKLPDPELEVEISTDSAGVYKTKLSARRDGANAGQPRAWEGYGHTQADSVKEAWKKSLADPLSGEYLNK